MPTLRKPIFKKNTTVPQDLAPESVLTFTTKEGKWTLYRLMGLELIAKDKSWQNYKAILVPHETWLSTRKARKTGQLNFWFGWNPDKKYLSRGRSDLPALADKYPTMYRVVCKYFEVAPWGDHPSWKLIGTVSASARKGKQEQWNLYHSAAPEYSSAGWKGLHLTSENRQLLGLGWNVNEARFNKMYATNCLSNNSDLFQKIKTLCEQTFTTNVIPFRFKKQNTNGA